MNLKGWLPLSLDCHGYFVLGVFGGVVGPLPMTVGHNLGPGMQHPSGKTPMILVEIRTPKASGNWTKKKATTFVDSAG